jgi:hypothetical protein
MSRHRVITAAVVVAAAVALVACTTSPPAAPAALSDRQADPVVVTGVQVASLKGTPVGDVVAFSWRAGAWSQIPVQVDQRKTVELNTVYGKPANTTNPVFATVYADPNTFVGAGSGVLGDLDQIAFMAADTGDVAPSANPADVVPASRVHLTITDPRDGHQASAYLFRRASSALSPDAGRRYVFYSFQLVSGAYKTTYRFDVGPNPETSSVRTSDYTRGFHDRWQDDVLTVNTPGASGVDILDRQKELFAPGNCVRSEDTFDTGEGAFIANISGPVRAIRSFIGANSGPYTERTQIFYAEREEDVTDLRVHAIPGVMNFFDYSNAARGMTYSNSLNTGGFAIDGKPDSVVPGRQQWDKVDGPQGALTHVWTLQTSISPITVTNYYEDNDTNPSTQCTGDSVALGSSGSWITSALPNTDPHNGTAATLSGTDTMFYESPGRSASDASLHAAQVANPLTVSVQQGS